MSVAYVAFQSITVNDVIAYLRLSEVDSDEQKLLTTALAAARSFILHHTGRTATEADTIPEFTIAVYAICEEMYDKRTYTVDKESVSPIVDAILGARSMNLL